VGVTIEDLARIADAIAVAGVPDERVGFCLDTAHLWGAGFDLADPDAVDDVVERFDRLIGLDRLAMLHVNDSKASLGSRLDRHQHVAAGGIGERGFAALLGHPRLVAVPAFLETPGMDEGYDAVNMERVRGLLEGERLEALPEAALHLRGSRARTAPADADEPTDALPEPRRRRRTPQRGQAAASSSRTRQPQPA
jgi:sugar phosphate isomerase/epimerase